MICAYDLEAKCWVAAGKGPLRPIIVEAVTQRDARLAWTEDFEAQQLEETMFARQYEQDQVATARSLENDIDARWK